MTILSMRKLLALGLIVMMFVASSCATKSQYQTAVGKKKISSFQLDSVQLGFNFLTQLYEHPIGGFGV